jgi:hypothetical protein
MSEGREEGPTTTGRGRGLGLSRNNLLPGRLCGWAFLVRAQSIFADACRLSSLRFELEARPAPLISTSHRAPRRRGPCAASEHRERAGGPRLPEARGTGPRAADGMRGRCPTGTARDVRRCGGGAVVVRWRWLSVTCLLRRFPPPTRLFAAARDADAPESGWWR